jgi:hypothetical protein
MMESNDFYSALGDLPQYYNFGVTDGSITGEIRRGENRGSTVNPVTAVALRETGVLFGTNKRDTVKAGRAIGLSNKFINHVYSASNAASNRGNTQVVRGKIKNALEI